MGGVCLAGCLKSHYNSESSATLYLNPSEPLFPFLAAEDPPGKLVRQRLSVDSALLWHPLGALSRHHILATHMVLGPYFQDGWRL